MERAINVYQDLEFLRIRAHGLEKLTLGDIIENKESFTQFVYRLDSPKLASRYQGVLYPAHGIYDRKQIVLHGMWKYFSERHREYIYRPENLLKRDPTLFRYIERIGHEQG